MKRLLLILSSALFVLGCQKEVYHDITVSVNPSEGGRVSPSSGPVLDGTSVSFKATPKGDYVFTGWSGSISGTENPKTVTVSQDMNVTANFTLRSYPLTITIEGDGTVAEKVITTKSEYQSGTVVELTATPSDHWLFDHWEGDITGATNPAQITVSFAKNVKAVFVEKNYPLNIEIEGEGTVSEKVIQTKSIYQEGAVVELTANPSNGWLFDHWDGDLSGNDNPAQITVSSEKTVKAVFVKNNYSFNVKIVGPGAVDEYLVEPTKASLEYGQRVRLVAIPSDGASFKGWSGDVSGISESIIVDVTKNKSVIASFEKDIIRVPEQDLSLPSSYRKQLFPGFDFSDFCPWGLTHFLPLDYNGDGLLDVICCSGSEEYVPVGFYLGTEDGFFEKDPKNHNKFTGPEYCPRKWLYGDINGDLVSDICIIGHGYDGEPWPGASPVILLSSNTGIYDCKRITDVKGFYHGSALGDYDNDGDLDLFLLDGNKSKILVNDGLGNFAINDFSIDFNDVLGSMYTCEFFDINHDGFLDLIVGGHEHEGREWHSYSNTTCVFWGNGEDYTEENSTRFPRFVDGFGVTLDYCFYDIDNDGQEEIINIRTGDGLSQTSYVGWKIQIIDIIGYSFIDVTSSYVNNVNNGDLTALSVFWLDIEEVDGKTYLCGRSTPKAQRLYEIEGKQFIRCKEDETDPSIKEGICIYSDGNGERGTYVNLGYKLDRYGGSSCISFSDWPTWTGWAVDYPDFMDFSALEKNGYCLEFAIKNFDPDLVISFSFETRIQTDPWYFPTYAYTYWGNEHKSDGNWELIHVPLSSLKCGEEWSGYYWNTIKTLNIMPGECHGKDFYLDEIRIRRIIANK